MTDEEVKKTRLISLKHIARTVYNANEISEMIKYKKDELKILEEVYSEKLLDEL